MRGEPTPAERARWRALRNDQLHGLTFRRQAPIGHYIVDFFCPTARLIIEIDHETHADPTRDATRTQWLEAHNLRILRFRNNEVLANLDGVLLTIAEHAA